MELASTEIAQDLKQDIKKLADDANDRCGQSYETYVKFFSSLVEYDFPIGSPLRDEALAIARTYDYASPEELQRDADLNAEFGHCSHGLDPNCCPCGCGDFDDNTDYDPMPDMDLSGIFFSVTEALPLIIAKLNNCIKPENELDRLDPAEAIREINNIIDETNYHQESDDKTDVDRNAFAAVVRLMSEHSVTGKKFTPEVILLAAQHGVIEPESSSMWAKIKNRLSF